MTSPFYFFQILFLLPFALHFSHAFHTRPSNVTDQHALLAFKSKITFDPFGSLESWTSNASFCKWTGVQCSQRRQRVVSLNLSSLALEEYGMGGEVTTKGDVYSYGIVLLEMVTRKKPTNNMFGAEINLSKWVSRSFPNTIEDVVDFHLLNNAPHNKEDKEFNCLRQLINLGLLCTKESPEGRPNMINIVKILHGIKGTLLGFPSTPPLQSDMSYLLSSTNVIGRNDDSQTSSSF